jgi:hypothetical protein
VLGGSSGCGNSTSVGYSVFLRAAQSETLALGRGVPRWETALPAERPGAPAPESPHPDLPTTAALCGLKPYSVPPREARSDPCIAPAALPPGPLGRLAEGHATSATRTSQNTACSSVHIAPAQLRKIKRDSA